MALQTNEAYATIYPQVAPQHTSEMLSAKCGWNRKARTSALHTNIQVVASIEIPKMYTLVTITFFITPFVFG